MPISVLSGNSTKILGTGTYTYDASQNLMVYSNRSLHVDAGEPNSYYIRGNTFSDLTGRGINGTLTNSFSGTNPTFSQFNGGYFNFNGFKGDSTGNSFIEFNADQLPSGNQPSTIITWARCIDFSANNRYIFSYGNPGTDQARYLGVNTGDKFIVGGYLGINSELVSNRSVSFDEWFQLTFVYTGTSILLYVNGVLDGSRPKSLSTVVNGKKARIGRQITTDGGSVASGDGYWYGDISEVIVYDRVLNPQEIYQDYKIKRYRYGLGEVTRPTDNSEPTAPTVTTDVVSSINTTTALSGVQIVSDGNSNITVSGIIWSISNSNLTTALGTKTTGGSGNITGLSPGVTYYVRAYATNAVDTSYGNIRSFTSTPIVLPNVIAITASYTGNSAFATGSVTGLGNATSVSARGFVWSTSPINQNAADSIPTRATQSGSFGLGEYGLTISPLNADTLYYVRAFATNTATIAGTINTPGTTYSSTQLVFRTYAFASVTVPIITNITGISFDASITTTGQLITEQGIIWKTDVSGPNILADLNNIRPGGAGTYLSTIDAQVFPNTTYYVYGYVKNIAGIAYSTARIITTDNFALITTDAVITANITNISATVSGSLDNMNGSTVTSIGFVWGDETNFPEPLIDLDITNNTGIYTKTTGIVLGSFNYKITGLSEVTNYYVKAYATNAVGTSYGSAQPFTTFGTPVVDVLQPSFPNLIPDQYILNGSILSLGGYSPVEVGFEYFITSTPANVITVISTSTQTTTGGFGKKVTLTPTTNYTVRAYVKYPLGTIYSPTTTFTTQAGLPSVITTSISAQTSTSANSGGNVTSDGGSPVTARGLVYATSQNPTTGNESVPGGSGTGTFTSTITGLTPGTTYYARAYASNVIGTQYGNEVSFTTSASTVPVVASTTPVTSIGQNTAASGGNITSDGGASVTSRGVVWSTSTNPQLPSTFKTTDGTGPGSFTSTISGLSPKTTYYVRAYATNVNGTTYGTQTSFATIDVPELTTTAISNLTNNSAQSGGSISTDNGSAITVKGVVWSTNQNPTIALTTKTSNGSGSSNFTSNLTSLSPSTTYYVRAYATNAAGTGYGNQVILTTSTVPTVFTNITISNITDNGAQSGGTVAADGASTVTARGVVWSTSPNPTVTLPTKTIDGTGTGPFTSAITGLTGNTTYYVKAYATNANGTSYGSEVSFTTTTIPTLTTSPVINVSTTFASSGGDITFAGGGSLTITARGVCWSTSPNPTIALSTKTLDGTGTGLFTSTISGLTLNTLYYVRAYATNANGTNYGNQVNFTTLSTILPVITNFARRTTVQSFGSTLPGEPTCASTLGSISAIALFDFDVNVASGGNPITESGIVSNTSPNPTINNYKNPVFDSGTQFLARGIGGLAGSQNLWYFRAYSYNGSSYVYSSNTVIFAVPDLIMDNLVLSNGGLTWTATAHISNLPSGFSVISKGFRWGIDTTYNNVSTSPYLAGTLNGANAPSFQAVVSGADLDYSYTLSPVIHTGLYWVKAWVQISNGTTNYKCWSGESTARTIEI